MGCKCGKQPEEISANLQNQCEDQSNNINNVNTTLNKKEFITMSCNKESSVYFDASNRDGSNPHLKSGNIDVKAFNPKADFEGNIENKIQTSNGLTHIDIQEKHKANVSDVNFDQPLLSPNINNNNKDYSNNIDQQYFNKEKVNSFDTEFLELLNQVRQNPKCIIGELANSMSKIAIKEERIVYIGTVKVQLSRGREVFEEAITYFNRLEPMGPLKRNPLIQIDPPTTMEQIKEKKHLKEEVLKNNSGRIDYYFRDLVNDSTSSLVLALVGANEKSENKKRDAFLNPEYKYIGITSSWVKKTFCAYFTFG